VIWIFSGIAQRIGQRIGLHRDGDTLHLPPFETEIRRRLWWQIMMLEGYSQKLAGTGTSGMILRGDVKMPTNLNDSDLFPDMKESPKDHEGATEMMFFLIRCRVGDFLKRSAEKHTTFDGLWHRLTTSTVQVATKDRAIDELEALFQREFLQYCDPHVPWHLMCMHLAKAIVFMMRFMAHSVDYYSVDMSQSEKDILFDLALQVAASQNLAYTMEEMRGFMWHVNLHFQWKAFIYLLSELRYRTANVDEAWAEVEKSYESHPSFDKDLSRRALPVAVNNLTLKAWGAYIAARGVPVSGEPHFIKAIRLRQQQCRNKSSNGSMPHPDAALPPDSSSNNGANGANDAHDSRITEDQLALDWTEFNASLGSSTDVPDFTQFEFPEQMTWSTVDDLLVDFHDTSGGFSTD
jgi:hypothetical protein